MQDHKLHGAKPGENTPIKKAAGGYKTTTATRQINSKIIAIRTWLAEAMSGFYLNRGIGADVLAMGLALVIWFILGVI